jgi:ABC-2 type transport system ATP-binding protein
MATPGWWNRFHYWFRKSSLKSRLKRLLPGGMLRRLAYVYNGQWKRARRNLRPQSALGFEIHIVEHCNLNCSSCCHFSPLAEEAFLDPASFEKDCRRIASLAGELRYLRFLGGEPLLHPRIEEFFDIARNCFPETPLELTTNGILLPRMSGAFWESCKRNRVAVNVTDYPIDIHFEKVRRRQDEGVNLNYQPTKINATNSFHFSPIDLEGKQNVNYNFRYCEYPNNFCVTLRDSRLYTCCIAAHARFFNEYFHQSLDTGKENSIGIYEAETLAEILNFLCRPIPFCKHCKVKRFVYGIEWRRSRREITEWTFTGN